MRDSDSMLANKHCKKSVHFAERQFFKVETNINVKLSQSLFIFSFLRDVFKDPKIVSTNLYISLKPNYYFFESKKIVGARKKTRRIFIYIIPGFHRVDRFISLYIRFHIKYLFIFFNFISMFN